MTRISAATLVADIGGTNARFAILERGRLRCLAVCKVADYPSPLEAIAAFLTGAAQGHEPKAAAIAAAGPVSDGRVALTNAPWIIEGAAIRAAFGMASALIVNDFAALALAVPALPASGIHAIGPGTASDDAPIVVIGPGTGFGASALIRDGRREIPLVTEGGHATLAGENRREDAIIEALRGRVGHVSVERALSGDGLVHLYSAAAALAGRDAGPLTAAEVVSNAIAGNCAECRAALDLFCALLGSVAGNIALTLGARGGVYIGGGMVPRFVDYLARSTFRERFEAKGRMSGYLRAIPTAVIIHPHPALLGLARLVKSGRQH